MATMMSIHEGTLDACMANAIVYSQHVFSNGLIISGRVMCELWKLIIMYHYLELFNVILSLDFALYSLIKAHNKIHGNMKVFFFIKICLEEFMLPAGLLVLRIVLCP